MGGKESPYSTMSSRSTIELTGNPCPQKCNTHLGLGLVHSSEAGNDLSHEEGPRQSTGRQRNKGEPPPVQRKTQPHHDSDDDALRNGTESYACEKHTLDRVLDLCLMTVPCMHECIHSTLNVQLAREKLAMPSITHTALHSELCNMSLVISNVTSAVPATCTAGCSGINSLTSLDTRISGSSSDVSGPISQHQAVRGMDVGLDDL